MRWRIWLAGCWTLVILTLCWLPRPYVSIEERGPRLFSIPHLDKMVHVGIFAVFAFLWMSVESPKFRYGRVLLAGLALTAITELGQETPMVNRDATVGDALADLGGTILGLVGYLLVRKRLVKRVVRVEG